MFNRSISAADIHTVRIKKIMSIVQHLREITIYSMAINEWFKVMIIITSKSHHNNNVFHRGRWADNSDFFFLRDRYYLSSIYQLIYLFKNKQTNKKTSICPLQRQRDSKSKIFIMSSKPWQLQFLARHAFDQRKKKKRFYYSMPQSCQCTCSLSQVKSSSTKPIHNW